MLYKNIKIIIISCIVVLLILSFSSFGINNLFIKKKRNTDSNLIINERKINFIVETLKKKYLFRKQNSKIDNLSEIKRKVNLYIKKKQNYINKIKKLDIEVKKQELIRNLKNIEYFKKNGLFSKKKYYIFLNNLNLKNKNFTKSFSDELLYIRFLNTIKYSEVLLKNYICSIFDTFKKSIDISYLKFNSNKKNIKNISSEEIYRYYRDHEKKYINTNRISIKYTILNIYEEMGKINFDDRKLNEFYEKNKNLYKDIEIVKIQHIFLENENNKIHIKRKISNILKSLKNGKKFYDVIRKYSNDNFTKNKKGYLGWLKRGESNLTFEKYIFNKNMKINSIKIIITKKGFHIVKIIDKIKEKIGSLSKTKKHVRIHYIYEAAKRIVSKKFNNIYYLKKNNIQSSTMFKKSKFLYLNRYYIFNSVNFSKKIFRKKNIINKNINIISLFSDYIRIIFIPYKIKNPNYVNINKENNKILNAICKKKEDFLRKFFLEHIYEKTNHKKINIIKIKKKLKWVKINNIKRNNKKLNIELLSDIFSEKRRQTFHLFKNSDGNNFLVNIKNKSLKKNCYNKYISMYKKLHNI